MKFAVYLLAALTVANVNAEEGEGEGEGEDVDLDDLTCDTADDCDGDDEVCATTEITDVDVDHADYEEGVVEGSISLCMTADACESAATAADELAEDGPYQGSVSCGATKLVAGFAALALASAM